MAALLLSNNSIFIWDYEANTVKYRFLGDKNSGTSIKFLSDGRLAGQSTNTKINIWNVNTGQVEFNFTGSAYAIEQLWNGLLASTGLDMRIKVWNITNKTLVNSITPSPQREQYFLKQTNVNNYLASADSSGKINIWDMTSYQLVKTLPGHTGNTNFMLTLSNGLLVSGGTDYLVKLWNITSGVCVSEYNPFNNMIFSLDLLSNNSIAISGFDSYVYIAQLNSSNSFVQKASFNLNVSYVTNLRTTNDSVLLVTLQEGSIAYLNLTNFTIMKKVSIASPNSITRMELNNPKTYPNDCSLTFCSFSDYEITNSNSNSQSWPSFEMLLGYTMGKSNAIGASFQTENRLKCLLICAYNPSCKAITYDTNQNCTSYFAYQPSNGQSLISSTNTILYFKI